MTNKKLFLFLVAAVSLLTLPATNAAWSSGYDDDDDDGFKEFFEVFFDKLFKKLKKIHKLAKQNNATLADHEIRITDLELFIGTVVNGTDGVDGQDGAQGPQGIPGVNGTDGTDGINGINGTDGVDGMDGAPGADGVIALYKVVNSTAILPGYNIYEASCNPGDYAISGGYTVDAPNNEATDVFIDRDNGAGLLFGNMWTVGLLDDGNFDPPADISVTAICQDNP